MGHTLALLQWSGIISQMAVLCLPRVLSVGTALITVSQSVVSYKSVTPFRRQAATLFTAFTFGW